MKKGAKKVVAMPTRKTKTAMGEPPKKRKKGRKTLYHLLIVVLVLVVGAVLSLTVFFKIETITVLGSVQYSEEEIIAASGLVTESNLFLTKTAPIPQLLKDQFPYIEEVEVRRVLPPGIEIEITPSTASAAIMQGEEYALITETGKILERGLVLLPADVILVKGVQLSDRQPGDFLGRYLAEPIPPELSDSLKETIRQQNEAAAALVEEETDALAVINYVRDAISKTEFEGITNLDLSDPLNMTVMYENRLLLRLGTELELEYKLNHIKADISLLGPTAQGEIRAENITADAWVIYSPAPGYDIHGYPLTDTPKPEELQSTVEDALEQAKLLKVTQLEVADPQNITFLFDRRLLVRLGTVQDLDYKLRLVAALIEQLAPEAEGELKVNTASTDNRATYSPEEGFDDSGNRKSQGSAAVQLPQESTGGGESEELLDPIEEVGGR